MLSRVAGEDRRQMAVLVPVLDLYSKIYSRKPQTYTLCISSFKSKQRAMVSSIENDRFDLNECRHNILRSRGNFYDSEHMNADDVDPAAVKIRNHYHYTHILRNIGTFLSRRRKEVGVSNRIMNYKKCILVLLTCSIVSIVMYLQFFIILNRSNTKSMVTGQQASHPRQRGGTNTSNHRSKVLPTTKRPFPKWGSSVAEEQENGISFPPLLSFILYSSPYAGGVYKKYYRPTLDHSPESKTQTPLLPETLYVIQASIHVNTSATLPPPPFLYSSNTHRIEYTVAVAEGNVALNRNHKVSMTERFMLLTLQTFHQDVTTTIAKRQHDDDDVCQYSQWPFLCRNLYPSLKNVSTGYANTLHNATPIGGFPFLVWYGDFTGCNHHNWKQMADGNDAPIVALSTLGRRLTENVSLPLFTVAVHADDCNYAFPFPNYFHMGNILDDSTGFRTDWKKAMKHYRKDYSWPRKASKIVWRGSLTGRIDDNVTKCPRWNMVKTIHDIESQRRKLHDEFQNTSKATSTTTTGNTWFSVSFPQSSAYQDIFDAKITYIHPHERKYQSQLEHEIGNRPIRNYDFLSLHDFQTYRGIIDIDGHSWSGRFGSLLCLNSVVLKVDPSYVEYFYARRRNSKSTGSELQAWKHYIPIRADFSNLEEMAEYVLDPVNDDTLQEMVSQANDWCRHNMNIPRAMTDMLDIWDRYVELLNINNDHWLEQHWTDRIQSIVLKNIHLRMVPLNISDYRPIGRGQ